MNDKQHHLIDDLLVKNLVGEANEKERSELEQWLAAHPDNQAYFNHMKLIWEQSRSLAGNSSIDENAAWERFLERAKNQPQQGKLANIRSTPFLRIAAMVVVLLGVLGLGALLFNYLGQPEELLVASKDKPVQQGLPDGSTVYLNKGASIRYPEAFRGKKRKVELKGEGFFNIKSDKSKPFIVAVNELEVKVVGTSFNIREMKGQTEVIVETGIVEVSRGNERYRLVAGEKLLVQQDGVGQKKEKVDNQLYNYYRTKTFVCDNTPLWKLVATLNEAYEVNIEVASPAKASLPLTTTFRDESLDQVLEVIAQTLDLKIEKANNKIILK
ncbi:FecR domain-containing protein [Flavihumibacter rivuli]|uniref:FecR domain-containing protein n=1 Tax=Flavihumibacter rivuli TaxID=2838156 RepID=UPI001BDED0A3|nr:FecR domain-containing protein [Flavihumibacter rivuli]ULQ57187.1 FecR domain-containing protein [Flavihumibacter rivuli]